ncbi:hypothetical protein B1R32_11464 [Abditibacterium utsteinense]|uniref:Uncharacterized protein n=1 Tax=Abditibacterium utsteinense TaxID=1960156 RepID=A0A2S8SR63_9BACT|nr:hypothetical protein [Abditibacterium utsteinense]PQV63239.1 hypothetical protein B1R32_11464 [Abditibacterium utsteinense]
MNLSRFLSLRCAFWGGALFLALSEILASLVRSHFLWNTPFFKFAEIYLSFALIKGLFFGPILGLLTFKIARFWRRKAWDEACYLCLRGGFCIVSAQGLFALFCFLGAARFPFWAWPMLSPIHFALWLTLNVTLIWALLLLVAGFLAPSDAKKTVQISESLRF